MFLRRYTRTKDGKPHTYYALVESVRTDAGPRQQVVAYLGALKQAEDESYRAYRILIHGIFVMLAVFFLFGDRIVWSNCLTGIAWRTWPLLYSLPAWFTALSSRPNIGG
jgi:hypothetical protein